MCLGVLLHVCLCAICHIHAYLMPREARRKASGLLQNWMVGELPCGCWRLSSASLEEQWVLLTTEPSIQLQSCFLMEEVGDLGPSEF